MKKAVLMLVLTLLLLWALPVQVLADAGPKPSVTLYLHNMPELLSYADLLINEEYRKTDFRLEYSDRYDREMFDILLNYDVNGWRPALATGTSMPLWGNIICGVDDGEAVMRFNYFGVPDRFKVIVVTETGDVVTSNTVNKRGYQAVMHFDYNTGILYEEGYISSLSGGNSAIRTFFSIISTLVVEAFTLLFFRFSIKRCWKPLTIVNVSTQLALYLAIGPVYYYLGLGASLAAFLVAEALIFGLEAVLYTVLLRQHSKLRRVLYAIAANGLSVLTGLFLLARF